MKKIWMMLLMVSAVFAFSACSDDDDNKEPQNPVSITSMPKEAKIGEEFIINGTGFTTSGIILYLEDSEKERTKVDADFSNAGATFMIPAVTSGTFEIILTQGGNEWSLGNIAIEMAANPIMTPSVPEEVIYVGHEVILGGTGYEDTDAISLKQEEGEAIVISEVTVTANGLQFTLPKDFAAGEYTVTLVRGVQSWVLPGTLNVQKEKRIKSISIDGIQPMEFKMSYNDNNQLLSIEMEEGIVWNFTYTGNKITTDACYLTDEDVAYKEITSIEFELDSDGKIIKSTETNPYDDTEDNNLWSYSSNNLTSIVNEGKWYEGLNILNIQYEANNIISIGDFEEIKYSYETTINAIPGTPNIAYLINFMNYFFGAKEDVILGILLNKTGNTATQIPTQISTLTQEADGSDSYNDFPINITLKNNVLTLNAGMPLIDSIIITYEDIE